MGERGDILKIIRRKRVPPYANKLFPILILVATLFMGIGYASINSISLNINGEVIAKAQDGIYITEVNYVSDVNANLEKSKILNAYQTNLSSNIVLSDTNSNSSATYEITIYNSTDYDYQFDGVEYLLGEDTYNNENIIFELDGLQIGDSLKTNKEITFTITFKYNSQIINNKLKSFLNFKFTIIPYVVATYEYTGNYETFVVPRNGMYRIELWGASGGDDLTYRVVAEGGDGIYTERDAKFIGGYGGYTSGEIELTENDKLYIYVGEMGKRNLQSTFNGGGSGAIGGTGYRGTNPNGDIALAGFSGGGATDVRLVKGEWNDFQSLKSRIMVASGGGGATVEAYSQAGNNSQAGGLIGFDGGYYSGHTFVGTGQNGKGGTQISGGIAATIHFDATGETTDGTFGIGGYTTSISSQTGAGGGGGGYYGGSGASGTLAGGSGQGGGGGSSFISGHNGCNAISESSTKKNIIHIGNSNHYSGYIFTNTLMIDGFGYLWTTQQESLYIMPSYNETLNTTGNLGNGYARITFIAENED